MFTISDESEHPQYALEHSTTINILDDKKHCSNDNHKTTHFDSDKSDYGTSKSYVKSEFGGSVGTGPSISTYCSGFYSQRSSNGQRNKADNIPLLKGKYGGHTMVLC